ncbi:MAG: hypothetical protein HUJ68_11410 [Clostridia bacterium]|nr:hypothetical protein [Clostridia bacterium]
MDKKKIYRILALLFTIASLFSLFVGINGLLLEEGSKFAAIVNTVNGVIQSLLAYYWWSDYKKER